MRKRIANALILTTAVAGGSSTSATFGQAMSRWSARKWCPPPVASNPAPGVVKPSSTNFPNVQYPRIEANGRVSFRFVAPNAQKVQVSIVNQPFDMVKGEDGACEMVGGGVVGEKCLCGGLFHRCDPSVGPEREEGREVTGGERATYGLEG